MKTWALSPTALGSTVRPRASDSPSWGPLSPHLEDGDNIRVLEVCVT